MSSDEENLGYHGPKARDTKPQTAETVLVEALKKCREQFRFYAQQHAAKSPPDYTKARTNQDMVSLCDAALSRPLPPKGEHEPGLGWKISKEARDKIEDLISYNVHNAAALHGIVLATLPPRDATPPPHDGRGEVEAERREQLKRAFVAGCCAVLTWTNSGMPQDDLDEAGYDYAASVTK